MATKKPAGYAAVTPYFIVSDAAAFMNYLQQVFGATEKSIYRDDNGRIMHAEAKIDDSIIMFGQGNTEYPPEPGSVFIYVDDTDAIYQRAMTAGSFSRQEPQDKDYGRAAGVRDPFGNTWWITQEL